MIYTKQTSFKLFSANKKNMVKKGILTKKAIAFTDIIWYNQLEA